MENESVAAEGRVLEIVCKLDGAEVAGIDTELAEHTVAKVILVVNKLALLLAFLGSHHL